MGGWAHLCHSWETYNTHAQRFAVGKMDMKGDGRLRREAARTGSVQKMVREHILIIILWKVSYSVF